MFQCKEKVCQQELVPQPDEVHLWQTETVQSVEDIERVIGTITAEAMATAGLSHKETLRLSLALKEVLVNAHQYGHQGDWSKPLTFRYHVNENGVVAQIVTQIEDQGAWFDPAQVPDPSAPANLERSTGRGLFLMRASMSHVCHDEQRNCICLCWLCSGSTKPQR